MITHLVALLLISTHADQPLALEWPKDMPRIRYSVNPTYDQKGYRLGFIKDYAEVWFQHQEGQLLMGYNSGKAHIMDEDCMNEAAQANYGRDPQRAVQLRAEREAACQIDENPFTFDTFDTELYKRFSGGPDQMGEIKGYPVLAYYFRETWKPFGLLTIGYQVIWASTAKFVTKMWPIDPLIRMPKLFRVDVNELVSLPQASIQRRGFMKGRVVKATIDHKFWKTFEIIVQEVTSPNIFRRLSVSHNEMFDHIVMAMRTGSYLNIGWLELPPGEAETRGFWGYETKLRVESIELVDDSTYMQRLPTGMPRRGM